MGDKVEVDTFKQLERLLRIRRLKKRKLLLKDMIANLESALIPDLDA
jgi:hypothetical protein